MNTLDFKVFLEPDAEYGGFVVVCPTLPGCYSQGKTVSEALANIREAIELVLEDMESHGEPIPDPSEVLVGSRYAINPKLPVVSGHDLIRVLTRLGYEVARQRGSHVRLRHPTDSPAWRTRRPEDSGVDSTSWLR
jgi:predicted RNase H-like HicB family nuclease